MSMRVPIFDREKKGNQRDMLIIHTGPYRARLSFPGEGERWSTFPLYFGIWSGSLEISQRGGLVDSQRDTKRNKTKTARIGLNTHPPKVFLCFPSSKTTYGIKDGESKCVFHPFLNRNQFLRGIYPILKASIVVDVMIFIIRGKKKRPNFLSWCQNISMIIWTLC